MDDELLNYTQTARLLGMKLGTLYSLVSQGRIPHVRLGRRLVRFSRSEVNAWVQKHAVRAAGER